MTDKIAIYMTIAALLIGAVLFFIYPYQPQNPDVLQQYKADKQAGEILVLYKTDSVEEAKARFASEYPDYKILQIYKGKHGTWIRAVRNNERNEAENR